MSPPSISQRNSPSPVNNPIESLSSPIRFEENGNGVADNVEPQAKLVGTGAAIYAQQHPEAEVKAEIFNEFNLDGKVCIVTGGNSGLSLESGLAMCEAGAIVHLFDLQPTPSPEVLASQNFVKRMGNGSALIYHQADVTDADTMYELIDKIAEAHGRLDVCFAGAGILGPHKECTEYDINMFRKVMDVNCTGVFITAQACARQMKKYKCRGSIVMIASMSASITNRDMNWIPYNTSKSAVIQMARSMACELGKYNIRVNTISPGHILTKMTAAFLETIPGLEKKWSDFNPLNRLGKIHELRGVTLWLSSDASTFCTGSDIIVDGGHRSW